MKPEKIWNTEKTVCPFCSYETGDAWELFSRNQDTRFVDCSACGERFAVEMRVDVNFISRSLELHEIVTKPIASEAS